VILFYDLSSVPYSLVVRGDTAALRGRLAALRGLPAAWRKRRAIQARRRASFASLAACMSPLESPLALLRRYRHLGALRSSEKAAAGPSPVHVHSTDDE